MENHVIEAEPRTIVGKQVNQLRRAGTVPGVLYGKGVETTHIQIDDRTVRAVFRRTGTDGTFTLKLEGDEYRVRVQELQRHITRGDLMHIDFIIADE